MTLELACLFRPSLAEAAEMEAARQAGFICFTQRTSYHEEHPCLVVARYSALPYYRELEEDLETLGSKLVNSSREHEWIAHMDWAFDEAVGPLTFPTWLQLDQVPRDEAPYVLKGRTNSKKQRWSTHMFAPTWAAALEVQARLEEDGLIGEQEIVIRKYVPLLTYFTAIGGMPITKEYRVFVYQRRVLSVGFYWEAFRDDFPYHGVEVPDGQCDLGFVDRVVEAIGDRVPFYVVDVAQDTTGRWWVVELNDGQMSGLSGNSPDKLYRALYEAMRA